MVLVIVVYVANRAVVDSRLSIYTLLLIVLCVCLVCATVDLLGIRFSMEQVTSRGGEEGGEEKKEEEEEEGAERAGFSLHGQEEEGGEPRYEEVPLKKGGKELPVFVFLSLFLFIFLV